MNVLLFSSLHFAKIIKALLYPKKFLTGYIRLPGNKENRTFVSGFGSHKNTSNNLFAHASTKKGVTISSLNHAYYKDRFMGSRRIKPEGTF